jgi:hypothetical protein
MQMSNRVARVADSLQEAVLPLMRNAEGKKSRYPTVNLGCFNSSQEQNREINAMEASTPDCFGSLSYIADIFSFRGIFVADQSWR